MFRVTSPYVCLRVHRAQHFWKWVIVEFGHVFWFLRVTDITIYYCRNLGSWNNFSSLRGKKSSLKSSFLKKEAFVACEEEMSMTRSSVTSSISVSELAHPHLLVARRSSRARVLSSVTKVANVPHLPDHSPQMRSLWTKWSSGVSNYLLLG
jgi:hypothetical protein